jgi:hypothetical protein
LLMPLWMALKLANCPARIVTLSPLAHTRFGGSGGRRMTPLASTWPL